MSTVSPKVRRFESTINVKGFTIAYVLWVPFEAPRYELPSYDAINVGIDPLSLTSHFEETLLCFHGWLDNANSFAPMAPLICNKYNMRVIAFDLPGHGKSSHSSIGYYDGNMYMTSIVRIINRINMKSFHLMGHSLSAIYLPYIVAVLENSKMFNVKSLICIEQFGAISSGRSYKSIDIKAMLPANNEDSDNIKELPKLYESVDELVKARIYVTEERYPGKQTIEEHSARLILERNVGKLIVIERDESKKRVKKIKYYLRTDPKLRSSSSSAFRYIYDIDLKKMAKNVLAKIKCPSLLVFGTTGWPFLDRVGKMVQNVANIESVTMEGSHHVHADHPQQFLEKITPFINNAIEKYRKQYPNGNGNGIAHSKL